MKTKLDLILLAILCMTSCIAYAEPVTKTYTFTSKTWEAIDETGTVANWINGNEGAAGFVQNQGVQITVPKSGAKAISTKKNRKRASIQRRIKKTTGRTRTPSGIVSKSRIHKQYIQISFGIII